VFAVREFINEIAPWMFAKDTPEAEKEKPRSSDPNEAPALAADPVIWVTPGIDDSTSKERVWIGYKDETEHVAYAASVDQSAMTPDDPGMRGEEQSVAPPSPAVTAGEPLPLAPETITVQEHPDQPVAEPASEEKPKAADAAPEVNAPAPAEPKEVDEKAKPVSNPVAPAPVVTVAPDATPNDAPEREQPKPEEPAKETEDSKTEEAPTPPPAAPETAGPSESTSKSPPPATTPEQGAKPTPVPAGDPGEKADKEADATSIKQALVYHNGRVRAGEGVDIKTVRPEFSSFTVLTALPRAPVVEISFTTKGKVKSVRMLQSSGYKDVDEPILNAVWAWTAKGKKLDALAKQYPNAVLKLSVRMLL
jgi:hypothetical protein